MNHGYVPSRDVGNLLTVSDLYDYAMGMAGKPDSCLHIELAYMSKAHDHEISDTDRQQAVALMSPVFQGVLNKTEQR